MKSQLKKGLHKQKPICKNTIVTETTLKFCLHR